MNAPANNGSRGNVNPKDAPTVGEAWTALKAASEALSVDDPLARAGTASAPVTIRAALPHGGAK